MTLRAALAAIEARVEAAGNGLGGLSPVILESGCMTCGAHSEFHTCERKVTLLVADLPRLVQGLRLATDALDRISKTCDAMPDGLRLSNIVRQLSREALAALDAVGREGK